MTAVIGARLSKTNSQEILLGFCHCCSSPRILAMFHCFARHISMKWNQKWSNLYSSQCPYRTLMLQVVYLPTVPQHSAPHVLSSFCLDKFLGMEWLGHMLDIFSDYLRTLFTSFQMIVLVCFPTRWIGEPLPHITPKYIYLFNFFQMIPILSWDGETSLWFLLT